MRARTASPASPFSANPMSCWRSSVVAQRETTTPTQVGRGHPEADDRDEAAVDVDGGRDDDCGDEPQADRDGRADPCLRSVRGGHLGLELPLEGRIERIAASAGRARGSGGPPSPEAYAPSDGVGSARLRHPDVVELDLDAGCPDRRRPRRTAGGPSVRRTHPSRPTPSATRRRRRPGARRRGRPRPGCRRRARRSRGASRTRSDAALCAKT